MCSSNLAGQAQHKRNREGGKDTPTERPRLQSIAAIPSDEKTVLLGTARTRSTLVAFKLRTDMKTVELGSLFFRSDKM